MAIRSQRARDCQQRGRVCETGAPKVISHCLPRRARSGGEIWLDDIGAFADAGLLPSGAGQLSSEFLGSGFAGGCDGKFFTQPDRAGRFDDHDLDGAIQRAVDSKRSDQCGGHANRRCAN